MKFRAVSPLLAAIILIAITISVGAAIYWIVFSWTNLFSPSLNIQIASVELIAAGDKVMLSASVKNAGSKPLIGIIVTGYDGGGKCFKVALPPASPGQTSSSTLIIPLGASNMVLDGSGRNNHGVIYGATWTDGINGKALYFSGSNYVEISRSVYSDDMSAVLWVKPAVINDGFYHGFMGFEQGGIYYRPFNLWVSPSGGGLHWWISKSDNTVYHCGTISGFFTAANIWYNIAFVKSGASLRIYRNATATSLPNSPFTDIYKPSVFWVGRVDNYFIGVIDEVRVYNRALSQEEIAFSTTNPSLPITDGLVLWLPLDEGSSTPFKFTIGEKYPLAITAYTIDGSIITQATTVTCSG